MMAELKVECLVEKMAAQMESRTVVLTVAQMASWKVE